MSFNGVDHYENFPVASVLVPKSIRAHVLAIYNFARYADDIADEGDAPATERQAQLAHIRKFFSAESANFAPQVQQVLGLKATLAHYPGVARHCVALLDAFTQDTQQTRYANYDELAAYCERSANPVGRMMLLLLNEDDFHAGGESDAICTALQLTNFWQDVAADWAKQRIYLPQDEMAEFGVSENHIAQRIADTHWRHLLAHEIARTRALMLRGAPLVKRLSGRMRLELALTCAGGLRILHKIESVNYDVFRHRPTLTKSDALPIFRTALSLL